MNSFPRKNNRRKNRAPVRRGKNNLKNSIPPSLTTRAQRYGPGSTIRRITIFGSIPTTYKITDIGTEFASSIEFSTVAALFEFYKVLVIKLIFFPYNYTNNTGRVYFQMNFDTHVPTDPQLAIGDKTKIIGPVNTRNKVFKFIPPNTIGTTGNSNDPYLMNGWIPTEQRIFPAKLITGHSLGLNVTLDIMIEVVVQLRGTSDHYEITKKLQMLNMNSIPEEKKEEEKKEEEIKEEEENKEEEKEKEEIKEEEEIKEVNIIEEKNKIKEKINELRKKYKEYKEMELNKEN
jgi:hypothetical protein